MNNTPVDPVIDIGDKLSNTSLEDNVERTAFLTSACDQDDANADGGHTDDPDKSDNSHESDGDDDADGIRPTEPHQDPSDEEDESHPADDAPPKDQDSGKENPQQDRPDSEGPDAFDAPKSSEDAGGEKEDHESWRIDERVWRNISIASRWSHRSYEKIGASTQKKRTLYIKVIESLSGGHEPRDCLPLHTKITLPPNAKDYSTVFLDLIMTGLVFTKHGLDSSFWTNDDHGNSDNPSDHPDDEDGDVSKQEKDGQEETGNEHEGQQQHDDTLDELLEGLPSRFPSSANESDDVPWFADDDRAGQENDEDDELDLTEQISGAGITSEGQSAADGSSDDNSDDASSDEGEVQDHLSSPTPSPSSENGNAASQPSLQETLKRMGPRGSSSSMPSSTQKRSETGTLGPIQRKRQADPVDKFLQERRGSEKRPRLSVDHDQEQDEKDSADAEPKLKSALKPYEPVQKSHSDLRKEKYGADEGAGY